MRQKKRKTNEEALRLQHMLHKEQAGTVRYLTNGIFDADLVDSVQRFRNFQPHANFSGEMVPKLLEIIALLAPVRDRIQ
jgi:hypothetical protein